MTRPSLQQKKRNITFVKLWEPRTYMDTKNCKKQNKYRHFLAPHKNYRFGIHLVAS